MRDVTGSNDARFPTTRGSAVRGARSGDAAERERSWDVLVAGYWKPAYKHVRVRWSASREDAEDAIQSFFARAMEKSFFADFDPARARFRTFFRVCLDRHVADAAKARGREKRGGGVATLSLDFDSADDELARAGAAAWESPEECFDREWRRNVFAIAIDALRAECADGREAIFTIFERYDLCEDARPTYEDLARDLGLTVSTVTNHLSYARRTLRRIVVAKLEEVTANDDELADETKRLLGAR